MVLAMRSWRPLALACALLAIVAAVGLGWRARIRAKRVTYAVDIAPIVLSRCAPCHRPGEAGPFSLLTYEDVARRANQIRNVTGRRFMPPWKPERGDVAFEGDRSLRPDQIDLIARWVHDGAPLGDPADLPPTPVWPNGWQLGKPDLIVTLPPYTLHADGKDVYRNFVISSSVTSLRYVKAWELRPGSRAIHHAIINVDRFGLARQRDAQDPEPGFGGMDIGNVQSADGFYLVWAPGKVPTPPNPARAWRLDEHTDLVVQLHMQSRGKEEVVQPSIGLYFSDTPPTEQLFSLRVGDPPIDIPPGEKKYTIHADYRLPADIDVLNVFPHAHYLAKTVRSWATLPDHTEKHLLEIDDWDFNWQDSYTYVSPVSLPAGSTISMEIVYDNSADNIRNPNHPPKRVTTGETSADEMGNLTFEVLPHDARGLLQLRLSKYERLLAGADTARNHYNLANALADNGRTDDAIAHYRSAIAEDPALAPAHFNLGSLWLRKGDLDAAIGEFRAALRVKPDFASADVNLGHALEAKGRMEEAMAAYRDATAVDPRSALGHASLAAAFAKRGKRGEATAEFKEAVALDPNNAAIRGALQALASDAGMR
jgi:tetratricopeptide (TPR) repeat protein